MWRGCLRHDAANRKVTGSISYEAIGYYYYYFFFFQFFKSFQSHCDLGVGSACNRNEYPDHPARLSIHSTLIVNDVVRLLNGEEVTTVNKRAKDRKSISVFFSFLAKKWTLHGLVTPLYLVTALPDITPSSPTPIVK
jgi:hypothetical protein